MKLALIILDGWGVSLQEKGNAIGAARLPTMEYIEAHYPFCLLKASGTAVGLPWVESGNSEVGHLIIGSGRIVQQAMSRIIDALRDGSFFSNEAFLSAIDHVKKSDAQLHLMGLVGSGSVHSYIDHLYGLLELANRRGISSRVKLHLFTDGSDSPPHEGVKAIGQLKMRLDELHQGQIATVIGRDYAMDRDQNWAKTEEAFELMIQGRGQRVRDEVRAMQSYYQQGFGDGQIPPTVFVNEDQTPRGLVSPHDSLIFFNYREDSMRQLARSFLAPDRVGFQPKVPYDLLCVTMTEYEKGLSARVAFPLPPLNYSLAEVFSKQGKTQLHMAETHKYAHVTYFFNGMHEQRYPGEEWKLIPSVDIGDFALKPELKALEIGKEARKIIEQNQHDFLLVNFANADVVAHTGNFEATVQGCQFVDKAIKEIMDALNASTPLAQEWTVIITADHGHAEAMANPLTDTMLTEHTVNDVPFYLIAPAFKRDLSPLEIYSRKKEAKGMLSDIAPTILELYAITQPSQMTGSSLLNALSPRGQ